MKCSLLLHAMGVTRAWDPLVPAAEWEDEAEGDGRESRQAGRIVSPETTMNKGGFA